MDVLTGLAILAVALAVVGLCQRSWAKHPWSSGGGGGGPFGPIDEVFAPTRYEAMQEMKRQHDATAPAPIPGEPPWVDVDLEGGSVTIHDERRSPSEPFARD